MSSRLLASIFSKRSNKGKQLSEKFVRAAFVCFQARSRFSLQVLIPLRFIAGFTLQSGVRWKFVFLKA